MPEKIQWSVLEGCIGCGSCVNDCARKCLHMEGDHPVADTTVCNLCGHCVAVCPANAVVLNGEAPSDELELTPDMRAVNTDQLMGLIQYRRSIRKFNRRILEPYKLRRIIEAGRYAPTACNAQENRFVLLSGRRKEFQQILIADLAKQGQQILDSRDKEDPVLYYRAKLWMDMAKKNQENPEDLSALFMDAQGVLLVISKEVRDGSIAASYMQIMAEAEGIGTLMNGYISAAVNQSGKARELLHMKKDEQAVVALLLGYPAVRYHRGAPRKEAQIEIL